MSFTKKGQQERPPAKPPEAKPVEAPAPAAEVPAKPPEAKPEALRVAPGRSVMTGSQRGMLLPGDEAKPEFFSGGQARIDQLRRGGYLV